SFFFFFQAEDGIRDATVTGVQTCALPISLLSSHWASELQQCSIGVLLHLSVASSQVSLVHTTPSSQLGGVPFRQAPVLGSHVSRPLQKTLSSQTTGCPLQVPPLQVSSVVHLLLSSQGAVLGLLTQ